MKISDWFGRSALALALLGLCVGAAYASQSQTAAVPPGDSFTVGAALVAGPNGGTLSGAGGYDEDVNLCIRVEPTGVVSVNHEPVGMVNPMDVVWIAAECRKTGNGSWEMAVTVGQNGQIVHAADGVWIGNDQASSVTVDGAMVGALIVE